MNLVRLSRSSVGPEEKEAVARVLDAAHLGMGAEVRLFEEELAAYLGGGRHVICVATGTAALHAAVMALDIGPGDEVLVPTITYVACFQAVKATGAMPVACDVREGDLFIDLADAKRRLNPRTRAIMPVHYASSARGLEDVYTFAGTHGLRVIEDAAHAFGCTHNGRRVGSEGDIVCFSFDGIKNITSGEGGALVTSDNTVAQRVRDLRLLGVENDTEKRFSKQRSWTFEVHHQGFRYHMSNIMAAIGRAQLKKLDRFSERRRQLVTRYRRELGQIEHLRLLDLDWEEIVPHIFVVKIEGQRRAALAEYLTSREIESGFHYQPNHRLEYFSSGYGLPAAEKVAEEVLTLPMHAELTDEDQSRVIAEIKQFLSVRR